MRAVVPLLALLQPCVCRYAAVQQHESSRSATAVHTEWAVAFATEADDRRFWTSEWSAIEAELLELQAAAGSVDRKPKNAAFMQFTNSSQADAAPKRHSPLAGIKLNLNPKSAADLVPALAMLKGLYEDGKQRIAQLNAKEQDYKQHHTEKEAEHKARTAHIASQNGTVSEEFMANETRDENRLWSYWERVRERQHRQFHTSLKIQHATLEKVKKMMDMYEKTIAGKEDSKQVTKDLAKVSGVVMPEVVLLQGAWSDAAAFCSEALKELRAAGTELSDTVDA
uniref:Uncharacterized protein n=1 Tax=Alexandrium catenella TaxID=2925 RepID=A0A7S1L786_ALECA